MLSGQTWPRSACLSVPHHLLRLLLQEADLNCHRIPAYQGEIGEAATLINPLENQGTLQVWWVGEALVPLS